MLTALPVLGRASAASSATPLGLSIGRAVAHARASRAHGTFLVPYDEGALWWPLVALSAAGVVAWWRMPAALGQTTLDGVHLLPRFDLLFVAVDFG